MPASASVACGGLLTVNDAFGVQMRQRTGDAQSQTHDRRLRRAMTNKGKETDVM